MVDASKLCSVLIKHGCQTGKEYAVQLVIRYFLPWLIPFSTMGAFSIDFMDGAVNDNTGSLFVSIVMDSFAKSRAIRKNWILF